MVAAAILVLVAGSLAIGYRLYTQSQKRQAARMIRSLAVLPLENLSGDSGQDYFADGMTDELTTTLAKNFSLRVISRTSAMQYKGVQLPLRDIAKELGVDGILEGSVTRAGGRVHLNVQLILCSYRHSRLGLKAMTAPSLRPTCCRKNSPGRSPGK
jgi:TolB-like protein